MMLLELWALIRLPIECMLHSTTSFVYDAWIMRARA